jgi:hypothetical protein
MRALNATTGDSNANLSMERMNQGEHRAGLDRFLRNPGQSRDKKAQNRCAGL